MAIYGDTYAFKNITSATTTVVKAGSGNLHSICINTPAAAGTVSMFDNTAGSGTSLGVITSTGTIPSTLTFDVKFNIGLTIVTVGTQDVTVTFQ